jgi:hypothetical protein
MERGQWMKELDGDGARTAAGGAAGMEMSGRRGSNGARVRVGFGRTAAVCR